MPAEPQPYGNRENPLASGCPADFDQLIEAVGPASMLVLIRSRMSENLLRLMTPEDIWQETLLHAWRDRHNCEWRGLPSFRRWLLGIVENRIRDAADRSLAQKRGHNAHPVFRSELPTFDSSEQGGGELLLATTTPSRVAADREQAEIMQASLETLPENLREIVRLRLFEDLSMQEIAARLELGVEAVRHRFRQGAELYRRQLTHLLASRSRGESRE
ncbi:MAG: sigma-70 family RNA polymerase sigma factor [Planctomycetota bacterium]